MGESFGRHQRGTRLEQRFVLAKGEAHRDEAKGREELRVGLEAMALLIETVEAGSMSAAGRKLGMPLPTLSRSARASARAELTLVRMPAAPSVKRGSSKIAGAAPSL